MKISQTMFLGFALFITLQLTVAHHSSNCGLGPGTDTCGCTGLIVKAAKTNRAHRFVDPRLIHEATSVRRTSKYSGCGSLQSSQHGTFETTATGLLDSSCGPIAPKFPPIRSICNHKCSVTEVVPAHPGKPVCNLCAQKAAKCECALSDPGHSRSTYTSFSNGNTELNNFEDEFLSFAEQEKMYNSPVAATVPADPVSLSLALGLVQQTSRSVPESSLAFGQKSIPIDGRVQKTVVDIAEEKLMNTEKPLVELKFSPKSTTSVSYDELAAQQDALEQQRLQLEAESEVSHGPNFISYRELGYSPVTSTGNSFVSSYTTDPQVGQEVQDADDTPCGPLGPPIAGYQSGNVIVRSDPSEQYEEEESYEESDLNDSYSVEDSEPYSECSGFLAKLRASASAQNRNRGGGCGH